MVNNLEMQLLDILEENAKTTVEEMAVITGVSKEEITKTIADLEKRRIIVKYSAVINRDAVESEFVEALIEVKVIPQREYGYDDLAKRIYKFDEVSDVYLMAGSYDLMVRLRSKSMKAISQFVFEKLAVIDGVTSTVTVFIMRKYKEHSRVLLFDEIDDRLVITP